MSIIYLVARKCVGLIDSNLNFCRKTKYERDHQWGHLFIHLFAGVLAGYIAWKRNENSGVMMQILFTIIAFMFGFIYLLYYIIAVQMGNVWGESNKNDAFKDLLAKEFSN
jgi:hypothetical protein